jgi:hypothetical protein
MYVAPVYSGLKSIRPAADGGGGGAFVLGVRAGDPKSPWKCLLNLRDRQFPEFNNVRALS